MNTSASRPRPDSRSPLKRSASDAGSQSHNDIQSREHYPNEEIFRNHVHGDLRGSSMLAAFVAGAAGQAAGWELSAAHRLANSAGGDPDSAGHASDVDGVIERRKISAGFEWRIQAPVDFCAEHGGH